MLCVFVNKHTAQEGRPTRAAAADWEEAAGGGRGRKRGMQRRRWWAGDASLEEVPGLCGKAERVCDSMVG